MVLRRVPWRPWIDAPPDMSYGGFLLLVYGFIIATTSAAVLCIALEGRDTQRRVQPDQGPSVLRHVEKESKRIYPINLKNCLIHLVVAVIHFVRGSLLMLDAMAHDVIRLWIILVDVGVMSLQSILDFLEILLQM